MCTGLEWQWSIQWLVQFSAPVLIDTRAPPIAFPSGVQIFKQLNSFDPAEVPERSWDPQGSMNHTLGTMQPTSPRYLLTTLPPYSAQPHRLSCYFLNTLSLFLPQGFYICCFLCRWGSHCGWPSWFFLLTSGFYFSDSSSKMFFLMLLSMLGSIFPNRASGKSLTLSKFFIPLNTK